MGFVGLLMAGVRLYMFVIIARAIFSWLPPQHRQNEVYRFISRITEPVLGAVRRALPRTGRLDLSPLIVIVICAVIIRVLARAAP